MGGTLDRNGLRPSRYLVTKDGLIVMGSETGVQDFTPERIASKGRLRPGKLLPLCEDALDELEPEIISDLMDIGICLSGGGAGLQGLADRISEEVRVRAWVAEDPMSCVARGAGLVLEDFDNLKHWLVVLD